MKTISNNGQASSQSIATTSDSAVGAAGISEALVALAFVRRRLAIHLSPLGAAVLAAGASAFGASTVESPILGGVVALAIFAAVIALLARSAWANLVRQVVSR